MLGLLYLDSIIIFLHKLSLLSVSKVLSVWIHCFHSWFSYYRTQNQNQLLYLCTAILKIDKLSLAKIKTLWFHLIRYNHRLSSVFYQSVLKNVWHLKMSYRASGSLMTFFDWTAKTMFSPINHFNIPISSCSNPPSAYWTDYLRWWESVLQMDWAGCLSLFWNSF